MSYENGKLMNLEDGRLLLSTIDRNMANELSKKADAEDILEYKEVSGSVVTVNDAIEEPVENIQIGIEPVQDLHGHENPWSAGGGKNLFDPESTRETWVWPSNEVTDQSGAKTVKVSVTAGQRWALSNKNASSSENILLIGVFNSNDEVILRSVTANGNKYMTLIIPENASYIIAGFYNWSLVEEAQLELASSPTAYTPYSNICPISGWTECNVTRTGKNLCDNVFMNGIIDDYGELDTGNEFHKSSGFIPAKGNTTYVLSGTDLHVRNASATNPAGIRYAFYDKDKKFLSRSNADTTSQTVSMTTTSSTAFIRFFCGKGASDVQLEEGSVATAYEPFGDVYSIAFPSLAGTVYGGTLTVNKDGTGTLVVENAMVSYTEGWIMANGVLLIDTSNVPLGCHAYKCNMYECDPTYEATSSTSAKSKPKKIVQQQITADPQHTRWLVYDTAYSNADDFNAYIANNPIQIIYELASTVQYQLSDLEVIEMLKGTNNIFADTGDILSMLYATNRSYSKEESDARYYSKEESDERYAEADAGYTKEESDALYYSKEESDERYAEADASYSKDESDAKYAGIIDESIAASANVVSFEDGADGIPMALKAGIEPVQDLNGYDNPWPSGGGKNKAPLNSASLVKGTTDSVTVAFDTPLPSGTYILTCSYSGTSSVTRYALMNEAGTFLSSSNVASTQTDTITTSEPAYSVRVYIGSSQNEGATANIGNIMLRLSTETDASYEPYSNICPISGWTGCNVTRTGKNLLVLDSIAEIHSTAQNLRNGIEIKKPGTYTVSGKATTNVSIYARVKTSDGAYGTYTQIVNGSTVNNATYTLTDGDTLIVFDATGSQTVAQSKTKFENAQIQIELGSSVSSYEAPIGEVYSIAFPSSAGTVYGGTLTINKDGTGTLVVNHVKHEMPTSGFSLLYTRDAVCIFSRQRNNVWDEKPVGLPNGTVISNLLKAIQTVNSSTDTPYVFCIYSTSSNYIRIALPPSVASTAEQLHTWLTNNPVEVVYEITEPVTYQLTTLEVIETLKGLNNIFADTGDVLSIAYSADTKLYIDNKFAELAALINNS